MTKSKTSSIQRALLGTLLAASAAMTTPTAAYSDMVTDWNEIAIQTFPPTVLGPTQARSIGIVHAAIYDAINAIDRKHQVYAIDIKAPPGASMEAAAATAAHDTLIKLFPVQQSALDTALAESLSKIPDGPAKRDGITVGKESAEKTVAAHANDGATAKVPYTPGTSPDSWQPTPPTMAPAALACRKRSVIRAPQHDHFRFTGRLLVRACGAEYIPGMPVLTAPSSGDKWPNTALLTT
jgi:hypothetical protein